MKDVIFEGELGLLGVLELKIARNILHHWIDEAAAPYLSNDEESVRSIKIVLHILVDGILAWITITEKELYDLRLFESRDNLVELIELLRKKGVRVQK